MIPYLQSLADYWYSLPFDTRYTLWLAVGIFILSLASLLAYRLFRAALGHRKFRGVWYQPEDFQRLLDGLLTDQRESNRALQYDELQLIRKALLPSGFKPIHKGKYGGYF